MPDIATFLLRTLPIPFCNNGTNLTGSVILIASQYFQYTISLVGNCIKPNEHMCHRYREECRCYLLPIIYWVIVGISPMKTKGFVKFNINTWIGKIHHLLRIHSHKYLNQRENAVCKYSFRDIFICNLINSMHSWNLATFQLYMYNRHTVDEQYQIAPTFWQNIRMMFKLWLASYLIKTFTACYFQTVIDS